MPRNLGTYVNDYDVPRKKDVDTGAGGGSGLYSRIQKEQNYLYQVWYDDLDYDGAYEYFKTHADPPTGACSSVRNGNFYGRNFDWYYDNNAEFKVNVSATGGRYASQGMAGGFSDLTESFVNSGAASNTYTLVPFKMYDGINECGLTANINVVPTDNGTNVSIPTGTSEVEICGMMVIRYLLDHFDTAYKAVSYMQQHMTIYFTDDLHEHNYELHFMVADKSSTYIVEFVDNHAVIIDAATHPYMTNFIIDGVTFNDDGTVYTPETQTTERNAMTYNGITANGSGLERYNLIVGNYSSADTKAGMMGLMSQLTYSRAYTTSENPSDPYWYTEFVGNYNTFSLNCANQPSEFAAVIATAGQYYLDRDRDVSNTWQTTHSVVYDISKGEMTLIVQESQTQHTYMLERTTFTLEEWSAIQSGITKNKVNAYDDHIANTDIHVTAADRSAWNGNYTLPTGGIPKTDLSSDVQNSITLANSAIQDVSGLTARLSGSGAPTTSTVGAVGDLYTNTVTGSMYHCTSVSNGTYTWEELGAGGGGSFPFTGYDSAGLHNSIYRGKYLGGTLTAAQSAAISAGTFDDLWIGDYWTIGGVNYRIADFDYYLHSGDTELTTHHAVITTDTSLYNAQMNTTNTTSGGYVGSAMWKSNLSSAKSTVAAAFGDHVLSHREILSNAVSNGGSSGWAWCDSTVELLSEHMVCGAYAWGGGSRNGYDVGNSKSQLAIFRLRHDYETIRSGWYWLRNVSSATGFSHVNNFGNGNNANASYSGGVRPVFLIY